MTLSPVLDGKEKPNSVRQKKRKKNATDVADASDAAAPGGISHPGMKFFSFFTFTYFIYITTQGLMVTEEKEVEMMMKEVVMPFSSTQ